MKYFLLLLGITIGFTVHAQTNILQLQPDKAYDNISVQKLATDTNSTSFVIWVKNNVKSHKHAHHTETLYVLEGEADMKLGGEEVKLVPGIYLNIPANTFHSVKVTSQIPLKVLSVQAPEFLGEDRVFEK